MIYVSLLGHEMPRPATSVEARCWTRDTLWGWDRNERNCEFSADVTLAKDGHRLWTEPRALRTDHRTGETVSLNSWTCEGRGDGDLHPDPARHHDAGDRPDLRPASRPPSP
ncbi:hypothetical protein AB0M97_26610 [Streptomyces sp. NPDC051207]|uniref:hypothetical protein n=1 Tax=Streptomyces sp. NPDC051207 TaxID=3154641 RepID=UPI00342BE3A9